MITWSSTLEAFVSDNDGKTFEAAVKSSTTAGFGGSGCSVELLPDGTFRVLWDDSIGNLYQSPGLILSIPQFDQDVVNDVRECGDDADLSFALEEAAAQMFDALVEKFAQQ